MTIANGPRLKAAQAMLARFIEVGQLPAGKADPGGKYAAALQRSPAQWPVSRAALAAQLRSRLEGRDRPTQLGTSYCGQAAFLYCLLEDRPDIYVNYAIALWMRGHYLFGVKGKAIDLHDSSGARSSMTELHKLALKNPKHSYISDLDWMTMASLSVSTRKAGWLFGAPEPDDQAGSVTYPKMLRQWFTAAGCTVRADTMGLGFQTSPITKTLDLMKHWRGNWLLLQIDASLIAQGEIGFYTNRHWVVVSPHHQPQVRLGPKGALVPMGEALTRFRADRDKLIFSFGAELDEIPDPLDWETTLKIVSWGNEGMLLRNSKLGYYSRRIYGGYAFSRMN